ncbi:MAG: benzoate/H(+) symporter BenE family transporter, partial [Rubrivivax sp.]
MSRLLRDFSLPAVVAGFVAVLVGFTSSVPLVFAAAQAVGADAAQTASWIWALGLGMALTSIGLSLHCRQPVLTAWSTPGAALVAASSGIDLPHAVGAFIACSALIALAGATGLFERLMNRIPHASAAALLAGVLARFGLDAAGAVVSAPVLVVVMALTFLAVRRFVPRYAVPLTLLIGTAVAAAQGAMDRQRLGGAWAARVWTAPSFSVQALVGLALPLFIVTMASQNLPGVAAQRAAGYDTPVSPPLVATGLTGVLLAPFGGYACNLAAITAAICMSREAGEEPARRYTAAVAAGLFYGLAGLAGGAVVGLLQGLPRELGRVGAGLARRGRLASGLASGWRGEAPARRYTAAVAA